MKWITKLASLGAGLLFAFTAGANVHIRPINTATTIDFVLYNADGTLDVDEADGGTEVSVSCAEGAETTATNDFVDEGTFYSIALTQAEMNCARVVVVIAATTTNVVIIDTYGASAAIPGIPAAVPGAAGGLTIAGTNADFNVTAQVNLADGLDVAASTTNRSAFTMTGNGTGHGFFATSGSGATGNGAQFTAASTNGNGVGTTATGTGVDIVATFLRPTVAGRTLDVAAGGEAGMDFSNQSGTSSTVNYPNTTFGTVTNVTNAPTAGDFTATMKTSIGTAVAASAVASVTGAVGSIGTGGISEASFATTAGSFRPLGILRQGTAQAYSAGTPSITLDTSAAFGDNTLAGSTVWACGSTQGYCQSGLAASNVGSTDVVTLQSAYPVAPSGTITFLVIGTAAGLVPTSSAVAAAVWDLSTSGHTTSGTFGEQVKTDIDDILVDTSTTLDDLVDDLEARVGTPSNFGGGATLAGNNVDIEGQTDDIGVAGAGLTAADDVVLGRLPASLVSGRMDSHTGAMGNDVITAAAIDATANTEFGTSVLAATIAGETVSNLLCRSAAVLYGEANYDSGADQTQFFNAAGSTLRLTIEYGTDNGDRDTVTLGASCGS